MLETRSLALRLPPYHCNCGTRLVKIPKLNFRDVRLIGIRAASIIETDALRGTLFETWVVSEMIEQRFNSGQPADRCYWRDSAGHEVDVVQETRSGLQAVKIKWVGRFLPA